MVLEGQMVLKPAGVHSNNNSRLGQVDPMFGMTATGRKTYGSIFEKRKQSDCLPSDQTTTANSSCLSGQIANPYADYYLSNDVYLRFLFFEKIHTRSGNPVEINKHLIKKMGAGSNYQCNQTIAICLQLFCSLRKYS